MNGSSKNVIQDWSELKIEFLLNVFLKYEYAVEIRHNSLRIRSNVNIVIFQVHDSHFMVAVK